MKHIKIRFGDNLGTYTGEEKSFGEIFQSVNPMFCFSQSTWKPQMDIFETKSQIVIQAAISGVRKEDITIEVNDKAVKISGTRNNEHPDKTPKYRLAEIQFGHFERVLYLPKVINVENVSVSFSNGFLELSLEKISETNNKNEENVSIDYI